MTDDPATEPVTDRSDKADGPAAGGTATEDGDVYVYALGGRHAGITRSWNRCVNRSPVVCLGRILVHKQDLCPR